jgi:hypothetical protein
VGLALQPFSECSLVPCSCRCLESVYQSALSSRALSYNMLEMTIFFLIISLKLIWNSYVFILKKIFMAVMAKTCFRFLIICKI